jgi:WD40 repeat protein
VVQTNGLGVRPRVASSAAGAAAAQRRGSGGPGAAGIPAGPATTCVVCLSSASFFAGHADGVVRSFQLSTGDLQQTFTPPPPESPAAPAGEVTAIAVHGSNPTVLAVGHRSGVVNNYNLQTGQWLLAFNTAPGLSGLITLRRFNSLAAVHEGRNTLQVWDLDSDRVLTLDFMAELESIHRKTSKLTCAKYDDARGGECLCPGRPVCVKWTSTVAKF